MYDRIGLHRKVQPDLIFKFIHILVVTKVMGVDVE